MKCPYCLHSIHAHWNTTPLIVYVGATNNLSHYKDENGQLVGVRTAICSNCSKLLVQLGTMPNTAQLNDSTARFVKPLAYSRSPLPPEVPVEFADDYKEACDVLVNSAKASAALSRRCLQHLLTKKAGTKKHDLAEQIQEVLDSKQLPTHLAEDLDAIRNIGNFASHPLKSTNTGAIVDVEPGEAEWILDVLEQLLDFCFVQPARAQAKRDALNAKLQGLGKPPMKAPTP